MLYFFHFQCPYLLFFFLYTLDIGLFDKLWYIYIEYSTAMDMNELVLSNNMDEFQHHSVKWGVGVETTHRKIYAVRVHLYSIQKHAKLNNILFRITSIVKL